MTEPDFTIDPDTGNRVYTKTGRVTKIQLVNLKFGAGVVKAQEYIGIGPLVVKTPGGDVKAESGDYILTFEEHAVELKRGNEWVPVIDPITEKQQIRVTKLVLTRNQFLSMGWKAEYDEVELSAGTAPKIAPPLTPPPGDLNLTRSQKQVVAEEAEAERVHQAQAATQKK